MIITTAPRVPHPCSTESTSKNNTSSPRARTSISALNAFLYDHTNSCVKFPSPIENLWDYKQSTKCIDTLSTEAVDGYDKLACETWLMTNWNQRVRAQFRVVGTLLESFVVLFTLDESVQMTLMFHIVSVFMFPNSDLSVSAAKSSLVEWSIYQPHN